MKKLIIYLAFIISSFFQFSCKKESLKTNNSPVPSTTVNRAPFANAGADQTIVTNTIPVTIELQGSGTDPDGAIVIHQWTKLSGSSLFTITIDSPHMASTPVKGLSYGVYSFELKVTDDKGAIASDIVMITVTSLDPPPGPDTLIIGDWFSGALIVDAHIDEEYYEGYYTFDTAFNYSWQTHEVLSFVKKPGATEPIYQRRNMEIEVIAPNQTDTFRYGFEFGPDNTEFGIFGHSLSVSPPPPLLNFVTAVARAKSYQYRFIVVPKTQYYSLNINWNNYLEVAAALGFTP